MDDLQTQWETIAQSRAEQSRQQQAVRTLGGELLAGDCVRCPDEDGGVAGAEVPSGRMRVAALLGVPTTLTLPESMLLGVVGRLATEPATGEPATRCSARAARAASLAWAAARASASSADSSSSSAARAASSTSSLRGMGAATLHGG